MKTFYSFRGVIYIQNSFIYYNYHFIFYVPDSTILHLPVSNLKIPKIIYSKVDILLLNILFLELLINNFFKSPVF
jgi:hypothetical protein